MNAILMVTDFSEDGLQVRYLDWCSTQVAKRFLELSLDDVWLRSNHAASTPPVPDDSSPPFTPLDRIPDYLDLVRKTTLELAREMNLPSFAEWREMYLKDPGRYHDDMLTG